MFPLDISFNFEAILAWANLPFYLLFWEIWKSGGWLFFVIIFIEGFAWVWKNNRSSRWFATQKHIVLAIDVPKDSEQTPKAVENIFTFFHGGHGTKTWWESWVEGKHQLSVSVEIVSIDGYIQYCIWTPANWKDLVEAAIYSQYPGAEITEIEDYTTKVPMLYPDKEWNVWGAEYKLVQPEYYPLKVWSEFEHTHAEEGVFKDPMAAVLEALSTIKMGEQVWVQILVTPIDETWKKGATKIIDKLIGKPEKPKEASALVEFTKGPADLLMGVIGTIIPFLAPPVKEEKKKDAPPSLIQHLPPGEVDKVKAIERKISMMGYKCKLRWMYLAKKEVFKKSRGVSTYIGALKQYNTLNLNALRPDKHNWSNANYFWKDSRIAARNNKLINRYRKRSDSGIKMYVLSIEELASLWHFPDKNIKAPLLKKTEVKKGEPPSDLPVGFPAGEGLFVPPTLPVVPDSVLSAVGSGSSSAKRSSRNGGNAAKGAPSAELPVSGVQDVDVDNAVPPDNLPIAK